MQWISFLCATGSSVYKSWISPADRASKAFLDKTPDETWTQKIRTIYQFNCQLAVTEG